MGTPGPQFPRVLMRFSFLIPQGTIIWIPQNSSSSSPVPQGPKGTITADLKLKWSIFVHKKYNLNMKSYWF